MPPASSVLRALIRPTASSPPPRWSWPSIPSAGSSRPGATRPMTPMASSCSWRRRACLAWSVTSPVVDRAPRRHSLAIGLIALSASVRLAGQVLAINTVGALCLVLNVYALGLLLGLGARARAVSPAWLAVVFAFSLPLERIVQRSIGYLLQQVSAAGACGRAGERLRRRRLRGRAHRPCRQGRARRSAVLGRAGDPSDVAGVCRRCRGLPSGTAAGCGRVPRRPGVGPGGQHRPHRHPGGRHRRAVAPGRHRRDGAALARPDRSRHPDARVRAAAGLGAARVAPAAGPLHNLRRAAVELAGPHLAGRLVARSARSAAAAHRPASAWRPSLARSASSTCRARPSTSRSATWPYRCPSLWRATPSSPSRWTRASRRSSPSTVGRRSRAQYGPHGLMLVRTTSPLRHLHTPDDCLRGLGFRVAYLGTEFAPAPTAVYRAIAPDGARYRVDVSFVSDRGEVTGNVATAVWRWLNGEARAWTAVQRISPEETPALQHAQWTAAVVAALELGRPFFSRLPCQPREEIGNDQDTGRSACYGPPSPWRSFQDEPAQRRHRTTRALRAASRPRPGARPSTSPASRPTWSRTSRATSPP